jgi:hypothetical protein
MGYHVTSRVILAQWKNNSTPYCKSGGPGGGSSSSKSGGNAVVDPSIDLSVGDLHRVGPFRYLRFDESGKRGKVRIRMIAKVDVIWQ